jgi:hypothetical protein
MADRQVTPPARSAKNAVTAPARKLVQRRIQLTLVEARALRALVEQEIMHSSSNRNAAILLRICKKIDRAWKREEMTQNG